MQDTKKCQKFAIWAPSHNFVGLYLSNKGMYRQSEKKLLNSNISSRCPHYMANFGPLTSEIRLPVWGTSANFNRFRVMASLLQRRRSPEANQTLHDLWPSHGRVHYIYIYTFLGAFAPWRNFATCKIHFAHKSCVLVYWQRYCTALQQRTSANFAAWYKEWNYGTFAEGATYIRLGGHHIGHRPTFQFYFGLVPYALAV